MNATRLAPLALGALAALWGAAGCVLANAEEQPLTVVAPPEDQFASVSPFLVHRCGSLDCHGGAGRNLRLYGREGERLDPMGIPYAGPQSAAENEANYRSVVGLEPEIMAEVVHDHGAQPERLTIVRKARNTEQHTGGKVITVGDAQDKCLTSWLAGAVDVAACQSTLTLP